MTIHTTDGRNLTARLCNRDRLSLKSNVSLCPEHNTTDCIETFIAASRVNSYDGIFVALRETKLSFGQRLRLLFG